MKRFVVTIEKNIAYDLIVEAENRGEAKSQAYEKLTGRKPGEPPIEPDRSQLSDAVDWHVEQIQEPK